MSRRNSIICRNCAMFNEHFTFILLAERAGCACGHSDFPGPRTPDGASFGPGFLIPEGCSHLEL